MHELNLITGNRTMSHNSLVPWLLLKENNVPFNEISIDLFRGDAIEKMGLYSPSLKVPVLIHNDIKVWDSYPICEYIGESFLEGLAWPRDLKKRSAARSICAELHADFGYFREHWPMNCNLHHPREPDARLEREIARLDAIMYCCRRKHGDGGQYLFGRFSIADAFMAPFALSLHSYGAQLTEKSREYIHTLLANEHIQTWLDEAEREHDEQLYAMTG